MVGSALAEGARFGGGEAIQPGWRVVRSGQERRPTGEGDGDPAQAAGAIAAQTARDAEELSEAGSVVDSDWRGQDGGRPGVWLRENPSAEGWRGGHTAELHLCSGQNQAEGSRTA